MHITGKICAWVLVALVIGAVVMTGQAINVRSSWLQKADTLTAANAGEKRERDQKRGRAETIGC